MDNVTLLVVRRVNISVLIQPKCNGQDSNSQPEAKFSGPAWNRSHQPVGHLCLVHASPHQCFVSSRWITWLSDCTRKPKLVPALNWPTNNNSKVCFPAFFVSTPKQQWESFLLKRSRFSHFLSVLIRTVGSQVPRKGKQAPFSRNSVTLPWSILFWL